ncbi:hypothetical protein N9C91_02830, partial [Luminiphilus sp.]|nr:hypothetical protein [Luminiphilus sp.]
VMGEMLRTGPLPSALGVTSNCVLLVDNGSWCHEELVNLSNALSARFDAECVVILHPARNNSVGVGISLDVPVELWWREHRTQIVALVCDFSTAALNILSVTEDDDVYFLAPVSEAFSATVSRYGGKILEVDF